MRWRKSSLSRRRRVGLADNLDPQEKLLLSNELWAEANAKMGDNGPDPARYAPLDHASAETENPAQL